MPGLGSFDDATSLRFREFSQGAIMCRRHEKAWSRTVNGNTLLDQDVRQEVYYASFGLAICHMFGRSRTPLVNKF